jgi:hypothetical protein
MTNLDKENAMQEYEAGRFMLLHFFAAAEGISFACSGCAKISVIEYTLKEM